MNEWETIVEWIRSKGAPDDAEIILIKPIEIAGTEDKRLWIDVLSESYGYENCTDASSGPESDFDPVFTQYMLIPVNVYYKVRETLKDSLEYLLEE